eukprot:1987434-Rhodomonas_salina.4
MAVSFCTCSSPRSAKASASAFILASSYAWYNPYRHVSTKRGGVMLHQGSIGSTWQIVAYSRTRHGSTGLCVAVSKAVPESVFLAVPRLALQYNEDKVCGSNNLSFHAEGSKDEELDDDRRVAVGEERGAEREDGDRAVVDQPV